MKIPVFSSISIILICLVFSTCKKDEPISNLTACFTYEIDLPQWENSIEFINCSEGATSYLWDFGDDSTSVEENPIHYYANDGEYFVTLTAHNESGSDSYTALVLVNWMQVEKPNIYLYPTENIDLCIDLEFPQDGRMVESIPDYLDGWCVVVDPSGKIDNNYDFLFYESVQPDVWQYDHGWCVKRESLKTFFETNMAICNFSDKEIKDFTDYWIPLLKEHEYYSVFPQYTNRIDQVIQLNFSVQPDNVYRLFYGLQGVSEYKEFPEPQIETIKRNGFTVVEWGVFLK